jgi:hypothetical protein
MDTYEFHPFADAFPMMTDQEHAALVADIKANGVRDNIILYQGKILDGRNRYKALVELGRDLDGYVDEEVEGFLDDDEEALAYVISKNLVRRHLNESQRAMVAAKLSDLQTGQRADQVQGLPIGRAASMLNVGERSVARAKKVLDKGTVEQIAAVDRGEVAVSKAAKQIDAGTCDQLPEPPTVAEIIGGDPATMSLDELADAYKRADVVCEQGLKGEQEARAMMADATKEMDALAATVAKINILWRGGGDGKPRTPSDFDPDSVSEQFIEDVGDAVAALMNVESIDVWLAGHPGDTLRALSYHVNALVAELDMLVGKIPS